MHRMNKKFLNPIIFSAVGFLTILFSLESCNKKLDLPKPNLFASDSVNTTIGDYLPTDANYSLYNTMVVRIGLLASLSDRNNVYSVFAPNNTAVKQLLSAVTGVPTAAPDATFATIIKTTASVPLLTLIGSVVQYSIIPGKLLSKELIPEAFPNIQLPTLLAPQSIPGTLLPFSLTAFPSRRGDNFWYNNSPGIAQLAIFKNGVIYGVSKVAVPSASAISDILAADPQFTLFQAAISRGDAGQPPAAQINAALANPGANLTLFAPSNTAMKKVISAFSGGAVPLAAPDAVFIGFINNFLPAQTARGIVVYHIMGVRAFSVNFPTVPTYFPTLLNLGIPSHPGVQVQSFFNAGMGVDSMKVYGVGNGGAAATSKPQTNFDKIATNGVVHIIDKVLLPQ